MTAPTVVFVWRRIPPPFFIGGAEISQQLLAEEFAAAGWHTVYLASHEPPWSQTSELPSMVQHLRHTGAEHTVDRDRQRLQYTWNGVHIHVLPQHQLASELDQTVDSLSPELAVTSQEGAAELAAAIRDRVTVAGWLHSVSTTGMQVLQGRPQHALAVSQFVRERVPPGQQVSVLYPPFAAPQSLGSDVERDHDLLMINPVPPKGSGLLHQLIQLLPERRFTLVEGWWDSSADFARYPNVRWVPRTFDMDVLYARHRLLLVPSLVEDAYPRVIIEAALHGLPTLGSRRGGIPEAIADPSRLLPPENAAAWTERVRALDEEALASTARRAWQRATAQLRPCLPQLEATGVVRPRTEGAAHVP